MRPSSPRLLAAFVTLVCAAFAAPVEVYLIGGQSNATGQGYLKNLPPGFTINRDVLLYHSGAPHLRPSEPANTWHALAPASESPDRFGVELTLGNRLAELRPDRKIAIIKHAHSGTNLHTQWKPGADAGDRENWGPQFVTFVETVEAGLKALRERGDEPVVMGMVWHQGEADATGGRGKPDDTTQAVAYGKNLTHFVARVREQFKAPDLPFVYAMIVRPPDAPPGRDIVRQALRDADQDSGKPGAIRRAFVIETDDLPLRADDPGTPYPNDRQHIGSAGMLTEGTRMAEKLHIHLSGAKALSANSTGAAPFTVRSDFPGGSIVVEKIDPMARSLRFIPSVHADRGWPCWWYFKLEGLEPGTTVTLDLGGSGWGQPDQAFFSYDNRTWRQTAPGARANRRITYQVFVAAVEAWFAWGPPFRLQEADEFIARLCQSSLHASRFELARTRENRPVPALKIVEHGANESDTACVWVQARQHAWEAGSSWVARGFAAWLVSDEPAARSLRARATVYIVPIVDVDNVERGAGGKNQKPHDQNWDWGASPYFPEVDAAMRRISALSRAGRLAAFFDLHNPGTTKRHILFYVPAQPLLTPARVASQEAFFAIVRRETAGPIAFVGEIGPCGPTYDPAVDKTSESWTAHQGDASLLSLTWETPWNTPASTPSGYLETGAQLGRCIEIYLRGRG